MILSDRPAQLGYLCQDSGKAQGFTLLELLVVLAILSLLFIATPRLARDSSGLSLRSAAAALAADLRLLRQSALNLHVTATLVLHEHDYVLEPIGTTRPLPKAVSVTLQPGAPDLLGRPTSEIQFYPDGSASNGTVVLGHNGLSALVRVDGLYGDVTVDAR